MNSNGSGAGQETSKDVFKETKTATQVDDMRTLLAIKKRMKTMAEEDIAELELALATAVLQVNEVHEGHQDNHHCNSPSCQSNSKNAIPAETGGRHSVPEPLDTQLQKDLEEIFSNNMSQPSMSNYFSNPATFSSRPTSFFQKPSDALQLNHLLLPIPINVTPYMHLELEQKLDQEYESFFGKTHKLEFGNTSEIVLNTFWRSKVMKLEVQLKSQEIDLASFHEMLKRMRNEMDEMKMEKSADSMEIVNLREELERKIGANRKLSEQVHNLNEKHNAKFLGFQRKIEEKNNKIQNLHRTINEHETHIKELQKNEKLSNKTLKLQKKEYEETIRLKDSKLRNSQLCEEQSLEELQDCKKTIIEASQIMRSQDSELREVSAKFTEVMEDKVEIMKEHLEVTKKHGELLEKHGKLLEKYLQVKEFNTKLREKLAEERKEKLEKQNNGE